MDKKYYWFTNPEADIDVSQIPELASKIKKIKAGMGIDLSTVDFSDVRSIPDVWYIHRIFEMMLLHPIDGEVMVKYRKAVLNHWYAILAINFLGKQKFGLDIKYVTIDSQSLQHDSKAISSLVTIFHSVWESRPKRSISSHPFFNADEMKIFYVEDSKGKKYPIAMSSPATYIVPTADAWKNLYEVCPTIPWIERKRNEKSSGGNDKYIYTVKDSITEPGTLTMEERKLFADGLEEIANIVSSNLLDTESEIKAAEVFSKILIEYTEDPNGLAADAQNADIFPEGFDLPYIEVEDSMVASIDNPLIAGISEKCVCSYESEGRIINYIVPLPLSRQAVEWLLAGRASYKMTMSVAGEAPTFEATYTKGSNIYKRTFLKGEHLIQDKIDIGNVDIALFWPRYKIENWSNYYSYEYKQGAGYIGGERYSIVPDKGLVVDEKVVDVGSNNSVITYKKLKEWPKLWLLVKRKPGQKDPNEENVGYLLPREITVPKQETGKDFKVSIDFGTSSTMMYGFSEGKPQPISGENIWSMPMIADSATNRKQSVFGFFVPPLNGVCSMAPMQSILAIEAGNDALPFMGNWDYFRQVTEEQGKAGLPREFSCHSDLKWSTEEKIYTANFLNIISYFISLEARVRGCSNLDAMVTFPSSMSGSERYVEQMRKQLEEACKNTGLKITNVNSMTESEAVARKIKATILDATQFCSIDIGGGTSDIFLFKNDNSLENELKWDGYESSLLCGARKILLDCFVNDRDLLGEILNVISNDPVRDALLNAEPRIEEWADRNITPEVLRSNIEFLLSLKFKDKTNQEFIAGEELCERAISEAAFRNEHIKRMRMTLLYRISAIMYYSGMMTQKTNTKLDELNLQFAGNGSKTLRWISDDSKAIKKFLSAMFNAGAHFGLDNKCCQNPDNIAFSKSHKHEVAEGALRSPIIMENHIYEVLAGEEVELCDDNHNIIDTWPIEYNLKNEVFKNAKFYCSKNKTLKDFIDELHKNVVTILSIPLENEDLNSSMVDNSGVKLKINTLINEMVQGKMSDKRSFFMIGVDALGEVLFRGEEI